MRGAEHRADGQRNRTAQDDREHRGDHRRAGPEHQACRDGRQRGRTRDHHGLQHQAELLDTEVVFDLEHRQPDEQAAERQVPQEGVEPGVVLDVARAAVACHGHPALVLEQQHGDQRQPGAADEHQMCWTPERHVLAEDAVPDVVEREADQRVQAAQRHEHAADGGVPGAGDPDRGRSRLLVGQHHRQDTGDEQQEQPDQDEVVRRVGQRALVAALADVQAHVPDEAEQRADDGRGEQEDLERHPRRAVELAPEAFGEVVQPRDASLPVQVADPQQRGRDDGRDGRQSDHLVESGAAALCSLGSEQRNLRRAHHVGDVARTARIETPVPHRSAVTVRCRSVNRSTV